MTMAKMTEKNVLSNQKLASPNLEVVSVPCKLQRENRQKIRKNNSSSQTSLTIFKYLILSTTVIFTFGGLGFGLALRYGYNLQVSQSKNAIQNNFISE